jgi:hypothetical protein
MSSLLRICSFTVIGFLAQITCANAGMVNIHNIDIPDQINGKNIEAVITFYQIPYNYKRIQAEVPPEGKDNISPLVEGTYNAIELWVYDKETRHFGGMALMHVECHSRTEKPITITGKEDDVLGISVSYQPGQETVTCDITTPHK